MEFFAEQKPVLNLEPALSACGLELEPELCNKLTYHDACHLLHAQKVGTQPRDVIKSLPGVNIQN
jgi:Fe-S oxidoreductase